VITWHDVKQGSAEWHKLRRLLWTGSTAIRLLQGKLFREQGDFGGNIHTKRGKILEEIAVREYERKYRVKVKRPGFVTNTVYPNAGFSPDAIDGPWLIENKSLNGIKHEELIEGKRSLKNMEDFIMSKIPLQYKVQIFFGMIITGLRKARLLAFNPEYEEQLIVIEIGYDKLIGNNIRKKLRLDMKNRQLLSSRLTAVSH